MLQVAASTCWEFAGACRSWRLVSSCERYECEGVRAGRLDGAVLGAGVPILGCLSEAPVHPGRFRGLQPRGRPIASGQCPAQGFAGLLRPERAPPFAGLRRPLDSHRGVHGLLAPRRWARGPVRVPRPAQARGRRGAIHHQRPLHAAAGPAPPARQVPGKTTSGTATPPGPRARGSPTMSCST